MAATATLPSATPPPPRTRPGQRTPVWAKALLLTFTFLLIAGATLVGLALGKILGATEERAVQVVRSVVTEFVFLGYDDPNFAVATESNGILSWATPEIDKFAAVEDLLTEEALGEHIDGFRPVLEAQAETFYTRIAKSIEPEAVLTFNFEQR